MQAPAAGRERVPLDGGAVRRARYLATYQDPAQAKPPAQPTETPLKKDSSLPPPAAETPEPLEQVKPKEIVPRPKNRRLINLVPDTTGLLPEMPPGPPIPRTLAQASEHVDKLIDNVQDPEAELAIVLGRAKMLKTRSTIKRAVIGNPLIADIQILDIDEEEPKIIAVFGKSYGSTSLTIWDAEDAPITFLLRVSIDTRDLERRIRQAVPGANVRVSQIGQQIILDGQVPDAKSMLEVRQIVLADLGVASASPGGGYGGVTMSPAAAMGGSGAMASTPSNVPTSSVGSGGMAGGATGGMAGSGMGGMMGGMGGMMGGMGGMLGGGSMMLGFPDNIINRIHVPGPRQVMLKVRIAELNRTALRQIGVSWLDTRNQSILGSTIGSSNTGSSIAVAGTPGQNASIARNPFNKQGGGFLSTFNANSTFSSGSSQLFGVFNAAQFSLFINALRSNELAKILAEPNLMALDGQPARFLAGGQFPYPVPQSSSIPGGTAVVTVQFASFGAILQFIPHILADDVVRLDVEPVFSQLNFAGGTTINGGQVPAIDQRSARTVVQLKEGQTLAIAGLLQSTTNAATIRIPLLGDLPIVGPLFSSNTIQTVETELVVMVTPELVEPIEECDAPPLPGDRVLEPNDFEFYFLGRIEGKTGYNFRSTVIEHDPLTIMKHFTSEDTWVVGPHGHSD